MRALVARDLADAQVPGLSADRRFASTYNAALPAAHLAIACVGYRVTAKTGHHKVAVEALTLAIGPAASAYAGYFETCRRKRNVIDYLMRRGSGTTEAIISKRQLRSGGRAYRTKLDKHTLVVAHEGDRRAPRPLLGWRDRSAARIDRALVGRRHVIEQETDLDAHRRPLGSIRDEVGNVGPGEVLLHELERHVAVHLAILFLRGETPLLQAEGTLIERHLLGDITRVEDHET
jgi:hypothetical protein